MIDARTAAGLFIAARGRGGENTDEDVAALTALIGEFVRSAYVSGIQHAVAVLGDRSQALLLAANVIEVLSAPPKDSSP